MKKLIILTLLLGISFVAFTQVRTEINIPDIFGYKTLKCEFHSHTVFSDGNVMPSIRIQEAWRDGLDAISLTDHINYQNSLIKSYINSENKNSSYESGKLMADRLGITLIRGAEINRSFPPGHFNVLCTTDNNQFTDEDFLVDLRRAKEQGAYIQWNHPDYGQKGDLQFPELMERIYNEGLMQGMDVNNINTYPTLLKWANEKKLTITCGSDVHDAMEPQCSNKPFRNITLVFAKNNSVNAIREALLAGRTAAFFQNMLAGKYEYLKAIVDESIQIVPLPTVMEHTSRYVQLKNSSAINYELQLVESEKGVNMPEKITLVGNSSTLISMGIGINDSTVLKKNNISVKYKVNNCKTIEGSDVVLDFVFAKMDPVYRVKYEKKPYPKVKYPDMK